MRRRGIALLITIAFVTAIAALIAVASGLMQRAFSGASQKAFLIQGDVVLSDFYALLQANTGDINDSDTLDVLLSLPLFFNDEKDGISSDLIFTSDASAVNVNLLLGTSDTQESGTVVPMQTAYEEYFDRILAFYHVADPALLLAMIADTLDDDLDERASGSEIALTNPDFSQGRIYDMGHFRRILRAYAAQTRDLSADAVPWDRLIGFRNAKIDFNHITPEALRFIAPNIDDTQLAEVTTQRAEVYTQLSDLPLDEESIQALEDVNTTFYSPDIIAHLRLFGNGQKVSYTFVYDLSTQKVSQIAIAR